MTMTKVLRDMGHARITVHGFRSAFTDWAAEETDTAKEVVDKALAHQLPDKVEAAYRRTDFLAKRRGLMEAWADYAAGSASYGPALLEPSSPQGSSATSRRIERQDGMRVPD